MYNIRIRRPKEQAHIYNELTNKEEFGVFETYKDLFMLALVVGFLDNNRKVFKESLELINWQVFNESTDEPVVNMVAFLETENLDLLYGFTEESFKKKILIAEEYAAGGAEKIYDVVMADQKNGLQTIIDYVQEFKSIENYDALNKKRLKEDLNL